MIVFHGNVSTLFDEYRERAENYLKLWPLMEPPSPLQKRQEILDYFRNLILADRDAIEEAYSILAKHPTNIAKPPLSSGMPGYDADARYAYLILKDRKNSW